MNSRNIIGFKRSRSLKESSALFQGNPNSRLQMKYTIFRGTRIGLFPHPSPRFTFYVFCLLFTGKTVQNVFTNTSWNSVIPVRFMTLFFYKILIKITNCCLCSPSGQCPFLTSPGQVLLKSYAIIFSLIPGFIVCLFLYCSRYTSSTDTSAVWNTEILDTCPMETVCDFQLLSCLNELQPFRNQDPQRCFCFPAFKLFPPVSSGV